MVTARIPFAAMAGVLCTLSVFFGLWRLVGAPLDVGEPVEAVRIDFTRQIVDTPVRPKPPRTKPVREPRQETVGIPTIGPGDSETHLHARPNLVRASWLPGITGTRGGIPMGVDRDITPLVQIKPDYPPTQESRGVEGWVRVQFDVTPIGTVRNAIVVAAEPAGAFDEAALEAIARWRYNPRIANGVAVERVGLQVLMHFKLETAR